MQQRPLVVQLPVGQVPQIPPQPSSPHCFPVHFGVQAQRPLALQAPPPGQVPQLPPQPLSPHCFPVQAGAQIWHNEPEKPGAQWHFPSVQLPCWPQSTSAHLASELELQAVKNRVRPRIASRDPSKRFMHPE